MSVVEVEEDGGVAVVRLNRPERLNAIDPELLRELVATLRSLRGARAIVLEGAGRAFCVGEDLHATLAPETGGADELREAFEHLQELTRVLTSAAGAVVAAVHGYAIGGGAELALAADFIVLEHGARLRFPEVSLGHAVTGGGAARLAATVGLVRAKDLMLRSRWIEAEEALRIGLATVCADDARATARELAADLAGRPPRSVRATKRSLELGALPHMESVLAAEVDAALHCFDDPAAAAGIDEFRARRAREGGR